MIDFLLFCFCAYAILSFSITIVDGYLLFCCIWLFSVFYYCSLPTSINVPLIRSLWFLFCFGLILGKLTSHLISSKHNFSTNQSHLTIQNNHVSNISNLQVNSFRVNRNFIYIIVVLCLLDFFLFNSGSLRNQEYASELATNALSKSPILYSIKNLYSLFLLYATYHCILKADYLSKKDLNIFYSYLLVLPSFIATLLSTFYIKYLSIYALKMIYPSYELVCKLVFRQLFWSKLLSSLKRIRIKVYLLFFISLIIVSLFVSFLFLSFFDISLIDILLLKILGRSDGYPFLNSSNLSNLFSEYGYNYFYFFHPFFAALGFGAYNSPMGNFLVQAAVGGPNIQLPVVLYVIGKGSIIGYLNNFFGGIICGFLLYNSRIYILAFMSNSKLFIYWPLFFFFFFPLLLTEPSAYGHILFFTFVVYIISRQFSILRVFKIVR